MIPRAFTALDMIDFQEELLRIAQLACPAQLSQFPTLQRHLQAAVLASIQAGARPAEEMIENLIACEHDYINTDHPDFARAIHDALSSDAVAVKLLPRNGTMDGGAGPAVGLSTLFFALILKAF